MAAVRAVEPDEAAEISGLPDEVEVQVALSDIAGVAWEGLLALPVPPGLAVTAEIMEAELTEVVGSKQAKLPGRTASRHTATPISVVLGRRKFPIDRPQERTIEGRQVPLKSYETFAGHNLLTGRAREDAGRVDSPPSWCGVRADRRRAQGPVDLDDTPSHHR